MARRFWEFSGEDGYIDKAEFTDVLLNLGIEFPKDGFDALIRFFDKNRDGKISLEEFFVGIWGQLNAKRQAAVDKVFLYFDKTCDGYVSAEDLKYSFNVDKHPKFQSGEMTKDEIFMEFLTNFNDKHGDGRIDRREFNDYYAAVSADFYSY